jgi:hypothetical protein
MPLADATTAEIEGTTDQDWAGGISMQRSVRDRDWRRIVRAPATSMLTVARWSCTMKRLILALLTGAALATSSPAYAAVKTIVLVHGAFADGSG